MDEVNGKIAVLPDVFKRTHPGNYYSSYFMGITDLIRTTEECWYLKKDYHCEGYFRVPVPPTNQGKAVFLTNISKISDGKIWVDLLRNDGVYEINAHAENPSHHAKFAEVIVANREAIERLGRKPSKDFEIVALRGMPEKTLPPMPMEIADHLNGQNANLYSYTLKDLVDSTVFWNKYVLVKK